MFKRLTNVFRGFFSLFISGVERKNPEALMEVEKENLRKQVAHYNQGLSGHAALCERLMSQVKRLESEEKDLRNKATVNLRAGNRDAASQYALRLQTITAQLKENREQAAQAEQTYEELVRAREVAIRGAQEKIESLKYSLNDLKVKQATAELNEMASGMIGSLGGSGDTLNRLHDMVEEDREKAAGRARVARDSLDTTDIHVKEAEHKALADQALADFAAGEGITLEPLSGQTPAQSARPSKVWEWASPSNWLSPST